MFTLRTRSCMPSSFYRTSLPVVIEDAVDTEFSDTDLSGEYCQDALQHTLDLCLDHLDKLQITAAEETNNSTSIVTAAHSGCAGTVSSSVLSSVATGEKSDSGFWSQSFDSYSSSMATLEDCADVDLDAILGELCALGDELENESRRVAVTSSAAPLTTISSSRNSQHEDATRNPTTKSPSTLIKPSVPYKPNFDTTMPPVLSQVQHIVSTNAGTGKSVSPVAGEFDLVEQYYKQVTSAESPDNDSAFSDNVSCISSESGASRTDASCMSSGSSSKSSNGSLNAPSPTQRLELTRLASISEVGEKENIAPATGGSDGSSISKTEKIKIALEKINESDTKKLFITVHFNDSVRKSLLIDERMDCLDVCQSLAEKSETKLTPDCTVVEYLPELNIERFFEDDENLVENLLMWDRDGNSKNKLLYVERRDKYHFITRPEVYLVGFACKDMDYDELSRRTLLKDYFSSHAISPPELEGYLYLKTEAKKVWKKYWFVLRSSGLYYSTKPKTKQASSADLICLTAFDAVNLYRGLNWKKKQKAPTDFGFALKLPQIQSVKAVKNIRCVCTDDQSSLDLWMTGIRIAKYGRHLIDNFNKALERASAMEAAQESDCSSAQQTPVVGRRLSSSLNDSSENTAFDDDLTTGTIKRKPAHTNPSSGTPKLPFTSKTSQILMRSADERRSMNSLHSHSSRSSNTSEGMENEPLPPPPPELLSVVIDEVDHTMPISPRLLRSPPPTPPKPTVLQRKPSLNETKKSAVESRHSIGPTPVSPSHTISAQASNFPFIHELKNKSQSPLVTKKTLASVPETHDVLIHPASPARVPTGSPVPVIPGSPARVPNGHTRPQSMSPLHKVKLPPPPPRRSDMTKLSDAELALQRRNEGFAYDRSVSLGNESSQPQRLPSNPNFMADLTRVLAQKKRHSLLLHDSPPIDSCDYLPPPPPELLKGISPTPPLDDGNLRKKPPPPPKRSDGTYLTRVK